MLRTSFRLTAPCLAPRFVSRPSVFRRSVVTLAAPSQAVIDAVQLEASRLYANMAEFDVFRNLVPKERCTKPMVLIVGNHSSGKSTLINHILGRSEQKTGVAPTDDGFTVITRGPRDVTTDGPALLSDTQWGFGGLKPFGPALISHLVMKQRSLPDNSLLQAGTLIVDTPGMINTPGHRRAAARAPIGAPASALDRGYDFLGAMRWFAQRADVIVLMFDPNNPGTTGETLEVLTESLSGQEHKFLIAFNKVDLFHHVHDFARAYGTLTWNLAKVIHRKDLPRIFAMFTPLTDGSAQPTSSIPLSDFEKGREEVIGEILRASERRLDNIVTELEETALRVRMAALVTTELRRRWLSARNATFAAMLVCTVTPFAVAALVSSFAAAKVVGGAFALTGAAALAAGWYVTTVQAARSKALVADIDSCFRDVYQRELLAENMDVVARWQTVRGSVLDALKLDGGALSNIPTMKRKALTQLERIIDQDVRALRQRASVEKGRGL